MHLRNERQITWQPFTQTAGRMWPCAAKTTSHCGLSDHISVHSQAHLFLKPSTCDWISKVTLLPYVATAKVQESSQTFAAWEPEKWFKLQQLVHESLTGLFLMCGFILKCSDLSAVQVGALCPNWRSNFQGFFYFIDRNKLQLSIILLNQYWRFFCLHFIKTKPHS